jgi:hypothetical protein
VFEQLGVAAMIDKALETIRVRVKKPPKYQNNLDNAF